MPKSNFTLDDFADAFSTRQIKDRVAIALEGITTHSREVVVLFRRYVGGDPAAEKRLAFLEEYGGLAATKLVDYFVDGVSVDKIMDGIADFLRGPAKKAWTPELSRDYSGLLRMFGDLDNVKARLRDAAGGKGGKSGIPDVESEAPPQTALGRIAFGEERIDKVPFERDTKKEKALYRAIRDHINNNVPLKDEHTAMIAGFLKAGNYAKIFKEPKTDVVYRGMTVSDKWLREALKADKDEVLRKIDKRDASFNFTPRKGNASSWSVKRNAAKDFAFQGKGSWAILMHARVEDNPRKFLDVHAIYDLEGIMSYYKEAEAIGFGRLRVFRVEWWKMHAV